MNIAFLHTADIHVATFNTLLRASPEVHATHQVYAEWLTEAMQSGLSEQLQQRIKSVLTNLAATADVVVCTCSTLGPVAEQMGEKKIIRVDRPMMEAAIEYSPVLLVFCLHSTMAASTELLEQTFHKAEKPARYRTLLCEHAWVHFQQQDFAAFHTAIADAVAQELRAHPDINCVVLAQASMRDAAQHLHNLSIPIFSSPQLAIDKAINTAANN